MAYFPIAKISPQYDSEEYANWWLKAYTQGTTTPILMALDAGGVTTVAKLELNEDGFINTAGDAIVIPYINEAYDLWLFPTEAEADANDTSNAIQLADNIDDNISSYTSYEFLTTTDMASGTLPDGKVVVIDAGDICKTKEFSTGSGGGGTYDVIAGTGTANGSTIIAHNTLDFSFELRKQAWGYAASQVGAGTSDDTNAIAALAALGGSILIDVTTTLKPDTTAEINLISNTKFWGLGVDASTLLISESTNPASGKYGLRALAIDNLSFEHLTIKSDAAAQGIFNLGTLDGDGVYGPDQAGNLFGVRISQCNDVRFNSVRVEGFNSDGGVLFNNEDNVATYNTNVKIINCDSRDNRITGFSLMAIDGFEITGGLHERNGLQVFDSVDTNGNPTSTTRTPTNFIDGGTGYGIVLGRANSTSKLMSINGIVRGVRTKRNVRHGLDIHSGVNISIIDCTSEDDLITSFATLDIGPSLVDETGYINYIGGEIYHTVYSENRGYLFDARSAGDERDDSQPMFVSNVSSRIDNATIDGVKVYNYRFRQISNYSTTDTVQLLNITCTKKATVKNVTFIADDPDWYPGKVLELAAEKCELNDSIFQYGTRGTFDTPAFFLNTTDGDSVFRNNSIKVINNYSTATTAVERPILDRGQGADSPVFVGNIIEETTQGARGGLWNTSSSNARIAYNGFLSVNQGNTLNGDEYANRVSENKTYYFSTTGAGRFDGSSSGNAFSASSFSALQDTINQMPEPTDNSLITIQFEDGSYSLAGDLVIPFDGFQLLGNATEFGAATTKSVDIDNSGASNLTVEFDKGWKRCIVKGIQIRAATGKVINNATTVEGCVVENSASTSNVDYGLYREEGFLYASNNYFTGAYASLGVFRGASVVSRVNDDTGTQPTYGLQANGGIIMKNSTQPTGSTANELTANGGVIR